ncbi:MAG: hypothetical protein AAFQ87_23240 [Bacteroidota bacterium]
MAIVGRLLFTIGILMVCAPSGNAQTILKWTQLAQVNFAAAETDEGIPQFDATLEEMDGQIVQIQGYMLPLTVDNQRYVLSRFPFYNCYFCGNAGRETVIELRPTDTDWEFDIDDKVWIEGRLKLVPDPEGLIYELLEAKEIKP